MAARLGVWNLVLRRTHSLRFCPPSSLLSSSPLLRQSPLLSTRRTLPLCSPISLTHPPLQPFFPTFPHRFYSSKNPPENPPETFKVCKVALKKNRVVLVDGSVFYPAKKRPLTDLSMVSDVSLDQFESNLSLLTYLFRPTHIGVAFDCPKYDSWRNEKLFSEKLSKAPITLRFIEKIQPKLGTPAMKKFLEKCKIPILTEKHNFGADLIAAVSRKVSDEPDTSVIIVSNEGKAFWQLLGPNVHIYSPRLRKMETMGDVEAEVGKGISYLDHQILCTVSGVGTPTATKYLGRFNNSLEQFMREGKEMNHPEFQKLRDSSRKETLQFGDRVSLSCLNLNNSGRSEVLESLAWNEQLPQRLDPATEEPLQVPYTFSIPRVTIVQSVEKAREVVAKLRTLTSSYHAIDTETKDFDIKSVSPVENAEMICFSIYCGESHDFGNGPLIWVDTMGECEEILEVFRPYLTDKNIKKIFHNYIFDAHVFANQGIKLEGFAGDTMHMFRLADCSLKRYSMEALSIMENLALSKDSMQSLFGINEKTASGTIKQSKQIPELAALQRSPTLAKKWINYSVKDAEVTFLLRNNAEKKLRKEKALEGTNLFDFYEKHWVPLGEVLFEMERNGFYINSEFLHAAERKAIKVRDAKQKAFLEWAMEASTPDCQFMNPNSKVQIGHLLFGEYGELKDFEIANEEGYNPHNKPKAPAKRKIFIKGLGLKAIDRTPTGRSQVNGEVLEKLAGKPGDDGDSYQSGILYQSFKGDCENFMQLPKELQNFQKIYWMCKALQNLQLMTKTNTIINGFLNPLPKMVDKAGRIHASLNLNTETGRLSCRKPNLQNQPSQDTYNVRGAFCAEKGNKLIVADYSQLELRILAAVTNCQSMKEAFKTGGDFHSRTAMGMYPKIKEALQKGEILLEWDHTKGSPPVPLLKDAYKLERNRAKILNFSIAYGKTSHGLSKDFQVDKKEAQETLDKWYSDRKEVRDWQDNVKMAGRISGKTRTLLGRFRPLPDLNSKTKKNRGSAERAAINTPIQGGAADVVNTAMVKLFQHEKLRAMGWRLIMQIHDELILEGPEGSSEEALQIVLDVMEHPGLDEFMNGVPLQADAAIGDTWAECK